MNIKRAIAAAAFMVLTTPGMAQTDNTAKPDWITAMNQPCKVWNPNPQPGSNEVVIWTGECKDGLASGQGHLRWEVNGKLDAEYDGRYLNGKRNGHGVLTLADGRKIEGTWVNDELLMGDENPV
jgi:MORN repeat protein